MQRVKMHTGGAIELPPSGSPWTARVFRNMVVFATPYEHPIIAWIDEHDILNVESVIPEVTKVNQ